MKKFFTALSFHIYLQYFPHAFHISAAHTQQKVYQFTIQLYHALPRNHHIIRRQRHKIICAVAWAVLKFQDSVKKIQHLMTRQPCFLIKSNFPSSTFGTNSTYYTKFYAIEINCCKLNRNAANDKNLQDWTSSFNKVTSITRTNKYFPEYETLDSSITTDTALWNTQIHGISIFARNT